MITDPATIGLLIALIGILGVVVGASLTEIYASRRETSTERRLMARERNDRVRTAKLEALDQTHRQLTAMLHDALGMLAGDGASRPGRYSADAYPRADFQLLGDAAAAQIYFEALDAFLSRAPGTGARMSDAAMSASAQNAIAAALRSQEARVQADEPLATIEAQAFIPLVERFAHFASAMTRPTEDADGT